MELTLNFWPRRCPQSQRLHLREQKLGPTTEDALLDLAGHQQEKQHQEYADATNQEKLSQKASHDRIRHQIASLCAIYLSREELGFWICGQVLISRLSGNWPVKVSKKRMAE